MNIKRMIIRTNTALLGLSLFLLWLLSASVTSLTVAYAAGPWHVAPGGSDSNSCLSASTPCATINGAIGKASGGDTIYVAIGTYTGTGDEVAYGQCCDGKCPGADHPSPHLRRSSHHHHRLNQRQRYPLICAGQNKQRRRYGKQPGD